MKRRGFFNAIVRAAAIVALAPQLCFGRKLELPAALPNETLITASYTTASGGVLTIVANPCSKHREWEMEWWSKLGLQYKWIEFHLLNGHVFRLDSKDMPGNRLYSLSNESGLEVSTRRNRGIL